MDALVQTLSPLLALYLTAVIMVAGFAFMIGGTPWMGKVFHFMLVRPLRWLAISTGRLLWRFLVASLRWLTPKWR